MDGKEAFLFNRRLVTRTCGLVIGNNDG